MYCWGYTGGFIPDGIYRRVHCGEECGVFWVDGRECNVLLIRCCLSRCAMHRLSFFFPRPSLPHSNPHSSPFLPPLPHSSLPLHFPFPTECYILRGFDRSVGRVSCVLSPDIHEFSRADPALHCGRLQLVQHHHISPECYCYRGTDTHVQYNFLSMLLYFFFSSSVFRGR